LEHDGQPNRAVASDNVNCWRVTFHLVEHTMRDSCTTTTSFGKYFDDQRQRLETAMQNKNTQLYTEWRERYDERERKKQEEKFKKELEECSEKGIEISEETKDYYKKKFASLSIAKEQMEQQNDDD